MENRRGRCISEFAGAKPGHINQQVATELLKAESSPAQARLLRPTGPGPGDRPTSS